MLRKRDLFFLSYFCSECGMEQGYKNEFNENKLSKMVIFNFIQSIAVERLSI